MYFYGFRNKQTKKEKKFTTKYGNKKEKKENR